MVAEMYEGGFLGDQRLGCCGARPDGFTLGAVAASCAPDLELEPVHLEVRLGFDLATASAHGVVTTSVGANRPGARRLVLDAVAFHDVSVRDPDGGDIDWRYDGQRIDITWQAPFDEGDERRVEVTYSIREPISGMLFSGSDDAYPDRPWFVVTDNETERARYWLPCVDYPTVRTTFDYHLTAASDLTILAGGVEVGEESHDDGTRTVHWRLAHPCPSYLACLAVGRFSRYDDADVGGRPIAYFGTDQRSPEDLERSFGRTPAMMRWIEQRLGHPFPYPKYYQIVLPEIGGAMENITLVTWDEITLCDAKWHQEFGAVVDSINIHEMAHSYFGDAIVCRHFEHSWLKESWAVYVETVWLEENVSAEERDYDLWVNQEAYCTEADSRYVRPIVTRNYESSWDLFDRHLYPGGAWRIHMLRQLVGEASFWPAVQDYVGSYMGEVVETDDFRRKLEEHSGLNLTRFFDEWIHGRGYPKLDISFSHDREKGEGKFVIRQTQKNDDKQIGLFHFDLEIDYETTEGLQSLTVEVSEERHAVVVPLARSPRQIWIDPRQRVLFGLEFSPGDDLLRRALVEAPNLAVRIRAARELIDTGTRPNLEAVASAMASEKFWGVRAQVALALGRSGLAEAVPVLAAMLAAEEHPRAVGVVAAACARIRDPRLRAALRAALDRDLPYRARGNVLQALGAQQHPDDIDVLLEGSRTDSWHELVRQGALAGLGRSRDRRALEDLGARLDYGAEPDPARPAAVSAYGACAVHGSRSERAAAGERLADLTRDPRTRVRMSAGVALAKFGERAGIPALEALEKVQPFQDSTAIRRMIRKIRRGQEGEQLPALRRQLDDLGDRFRKLEERLGDAEGRLDVARRNQE